MLSANLLKNMDDTEAKDKRVEASKVKVRKVVNEIIIPFVKEKGNYEDFIN